MQLDPFVTVRFCIISVAAIFSSLVVRALYRNMRASRSRAIEALFFSVILTDWFFACTGMLSHFLMLHMGYSAMVQHTSGIVIDALFNLCFVASVFWVPVLALFVLLGGTPNFFVRSCWLCIWAMAGLYGVAWAARIQSVGSMHQRLDDFLAYFLAFTFLSSLSVVSATAIIVYARKFGYLGQAKRIVVQEKLLRYLILVLLLQFPYMLSVWAGTLLPKVFPEIAHCLLYTVPIVDALMYGYRPSCWGIKVNGPKQPTAEDVANNLGSDEVTLEDLDGLTNITFLAEGAAGSVYKANWLGIEVAMKLIKLPNAGADPELIQTMIKNSEDAFIEEATICARLRHPNITLFIRAGHYQGKLGILTEFCSRGSLKDVLKKHQPLNWRRKVALALHISKGLTYLHARNPTYIHRDLKCSNILVTDTWQAKLADFGISKISNFIGRGPDGQTMNTMSHMTNMSAVYGESTGFAGTWRWNAPEILTDPNKCRYSRATDMYSFGMVLWEIATDGEVPFNDVKFDFEVRERVINQQRPPLNPSRDCPEGFVQLIMQCWSQQPSRRPNATTASTILTTILDSMGKAPNEYATGASITASEFSNSIFGSQVGSQRDRSSTIGTRITNFFKGRFSMRSSTRSDTPDDTFAKYTSPSSENGSPQGRRRGFSRGFARLPSLNEYDFEANQSSDITGYSTSPTDSIMSPIVELPVDAMLEASGTFIEDKDQPRDSELEPVFVTPSNEDHRPHRRMSGGTSTPNSSGVRSVDMVNTSGHHSSGSKGSASASASVSSSRGKRSAHSTGDNLTSSKHSSRGGGSRRHEREGRDADGDEQLISSVHSRSQRGNKLVVYL
ncbi:TPA: hypothetical protein N0F65_005204 [Lagenidium giganteum]|uniref:Protein kinase domain-containing protein n=1 Tax=Lagenidium giganteum TaxID=4803 RepID=A0AAV2Z1S3_9STRA|nr:TPA: hypothetical protein N0F65_005204 [Lagenidium giganteum]